MGDHDAIGWLADSAAYVIAGFLSTMLGWRIGALGFYDRADFYTKWMMWPILFPFVIYALFRKPQP